MVAINEGARVRMIALRAPVGARGAPQRPGILDRLQAPSLAATRRVTLAGQTFGAATGLPVGRRRTATVAPRAGRYVFDVPAASAAMLTLP